MHLSPVNHRISFCSIEYEDSDVVKKLFSSYDRNLRLKFKGRCLDEIISDRLFINLKYTGISKAGEDDGLIVPHYILLND